jgi:hypothetical protein
MARPQQLDQRVSDAVAQWGIGGRQLEGQLDRSGMTSHIRNHTGLAQKWILALGASHFGR